MYVFVFIYFLILNGFYLFKIYIRSVRQKVSSASSLHYKSKIYRYA
jgi:hypothetical protein